MQDCMNLHQNSEICGSRSTGGKQTLYVLCLYSAHVHNLSTINTYSEILISVQHVVIGVINKLHVCTDGSYTCMCISGYTRKGKANDLLQNHFTLASIGSH